MLRKTYRLRLNTLYFIPLICAVALAPRLYYLQVVRHDHYKKRADAQHNQKIKILASRGKILDRNGRELAGSTMLQAAYISPKRISESKAATQAAVENVAHEFSKLLNLDFDTTLRRMKGKSEVPLARKLEPEKVEALKNIIRNYKKTFPQTAVYFMQDGKRYYPRNELASHIIGFTELDNTGDNKGMEGIEKKYNDVLCGQTTEVLARVNARQMTMEPVDPTVLESTFGHSVVLTLDENIQHAAEVALRKGVQSVQADAGVAVVYSIKTGELLAIANTPSFDLNKVAQASPEMRRNRALTDAIEPGSVMKIFTYTSLLSEDKVTPDEYVSCGGLTWNVPGIPRVITDSHSVGTVSVRKAFAESSNIGAVKLAMSRLTYQQFHTHLTKNFGFGKPTGIDLPAEAPGRLRKLASWGPYSMSSLPMGYELMVNAVHVASAAGAIGNNGMYMQPHIVREIRDHNGEVVKRIEPEGLRRIASPSACKKMLSMMESVVIEGTGKEAALENYRVGGKTGTTRKTLKKTAEDGVPDYIASFCGIAPIDRPEICVYVYIDNPRGARYYGGQLSAPVFREITEAALKTLKVPPSIMEKPVSKKGSDIALAKIKKQMREENSELADSTILDVESDDDRSSDAMPKLVGLTLGEATDKLAEIGAPFTISGSGVVIGQTPAAFETVERGAEVALRLGDIRELLANAAAEEAGVLPEPHLVSPKGYTIEPAVVTLQNSGDSATVPAKSSLPVPPSMRSVAADARPAKATPTPLPDMDLAAKRPPVKNAKSAWKRWETEKKQPAPDTPEAPAPRTQEEAESIVQQRSTATKDAPLPKTNAPRVANGTKTAPPAKVGSMYDLR